MRKVMVTSYESVPATKQLVPIEKGVAVFHGFGTDHEEYESGPGNFPIAIVEFPDGHIETPRVERIRFLTPNAKSEPTSAALSREVGSTDGLGTVSPAPTFGETK